MFTWRRRLFQAEVFIDPALQSFADLLLAVRWKNRRTVSAPNLEMAALRRFKCTAVLLEPARVDIPCGRPANGVSRDILLACLSRSPVSVNSMPACTIAWTPC